MLSTRRVNKYNESTVTAVVSSPSLEAMTQSTPPPCIQVKPPSSPKPATPAALPVTRVAVVFPDNHASSRVGGILLFGVLIRRWTDPLNKRLLGRRKPHSAQNVGKSARCVIGLRSKRFLEGLSFAHLLIETRNVGALPTPRQHNLTCN